MFRVVCPEVIKPTLGNYHPNEYNNEFHYYQSAVKWNGCAGRCNIINDLSNKAYVPLFGSRLFNSRFKHTSF